MSKMAIKDLLMKTIDKYIESKPQIKQDLNDRKIQNMKKTDDACSSTGTGLERTGSLGWTKEASGRVWRMPDRLWRDRIIAC